MKYLVRSNDKILLCIDESEVTREGAWARYFLILGDKRAMPSWETVHYMYQAWMDGRSWHPIVGAKTPEIFCNGITLTLVP